MNVKNWWIKREVFTVLKEYLEKKEITLLIGSRQVGKTTLMRKLQDELDRKGLPTVFFSLDFERDQPFFRSQDAFLQKISLEFGKKKGYVFIDEIQRKENAGLFLKGIYDRNLPHKFIVSGSGSVELKERVHESLAGRKLTFEVPPVTFHEFADFKTNYRYGDRLNEFFTVEAGETERLLYEYLNFGGYPRVITSDTLEEKTRTIDEIYRSYLERDIAYLLHIENIDTFRLLLTVLASQSGQITNYSELSHTLGISLPTVKKYLNYLEKTFAVARFSPYTGNKRKEIVKSPVFYFRDIGLRNYLYGTFGTSARLGDRGFTFQTIVANDIRIRIQFSGAIVHFWRTKDGAEVDFVVRRGDRFLPIEVKYGALKRAEVPRSLRSFIRAYSPERAAIVTRAFRGKEVVESTVVHFVPFWDIGSVLAPFL